MKSPQEIYTPKWERDDVNNLVWAISWTWWLFQRRIITAFPLGRRWQRGAQLAKHCDYRICDCVIGGN